jgi:hypothetical protein
VHEVTWETPNGNYHPFGGHRLWISLESPEKTYIPDDSGLLVRDDFILLHASPDLPPAKLGYAGTVGWLAYWLDGILFRKRFELKPGAIYPDGGCNTETYCNNRDVELESLGLLETLVSGATTHLTETWELQEGLDGSFVPPGIRDLLV